MTYLLLLPKTLGYHILSLIILIALDISSGQIRPQGWTYTVPLSALSSLLVEVCAIDGSCFYGVLLSLPRERYNPVSVSTQIET